MTKVRQSDRNTIIKSLKQLFTEGHNFRAYKLDLKAFHESIDRRGLEEQLLRDSGLSPPTLHVFQAFDAALSSHGITGLPRGLAVSAILSEFAMRHFDQVVKSLDNVYYFARFVDDIIVLTTGKESKKAFLKAVRRSLPRGVQLNHDKTRIIDFQQPRVNNPSHQTIENSVDFLGYRFSVYKMLFQNRSISRKVTADISPNKVKRVKSRIILSARQYNRDGNFNDFKDRLRVLSGNFNVYDLNRKLRRNVGIYYNYRFLDLASSSALAELDGFLQKFILAHSGKNAGPLSLNLTSPQKQEILKLQFRRSFGTRNFSYFKIDRLAHLVGCWAYE